MLSNNVMCICSFTIHAPIQNHKNASLRGKSYGNINVITDTANKASAKRRASADDYTIIRQENFVLNESQKSLDELETLKKVLMQEYFG